MQPVYRDTCAVEIDIERTGTGDSITPGFSGWIRAALDWLDRYWDDPELRSGFWRSGW